MKLLVLLLCSAFLSSGCQEGFSYQLDRLMDEALLDLAKAMENFTVSVADTLTVGGFVLTNPRLGEFSTLQRLSPAWLVAGWEEVMVVANLTMGRMYLEADRIVGPGVSADKPRITVKSSLISVRFKASADRLVITQDLERIPIKGCKAAYSASIERLSAVDIEVDNKTTPIDDWVERMLPHITSHLDPLLGHFFYENLDLCNTLRAKSYYL